MKNDQVLLGGIDFNFKYASLKIIQKIADELGGESRYDPYEQIATYMFENRYWVPMEDLIKLHEEFDSMGEEFAEKYNCLYLCNELHLTTRQEDVMRLAEFGVDTYLKNVDF